MSNINQTIIIRTDLFSMNDVGLISAQVAHIHGEIFRNYLKEDVKVTQEENATFREWVMAPYILVKRVPNLEALDYYEKLAKDNGLVVQGWFDTVYVNLTPTLKKAFSNIKVGISIGPDDSDSIRTVVGDLPLL
jgi:peptidyl-tRNA hydrolase